jgi:hypothetical protein
VACQRSDFRVRSVSARPLFRSGSPPALDPGTSVGSSSMSASTMPRGSRSCLADQRKESAVAFLEAAVAYFSKLGEPWPKRTNVWQTKTKPARGQSDPQKQSAHWSPPPIHVCRSGPRRQPNAWPHLTAGAVPPSPPNLCRG